MLSNLVVSLFLVGANPVDSIVQKHLEKGLLGVGVAVLKDGKVIHLKTYGKGATPKNDGHYRLASITKQFTSGVIVRLVREQKLAYEDTLGKLMPDTPAAWHSVTVRHLLTHTSGIPSYTDSPRFGTVVQKPVTPDGIWQFMKNDKVDFAPGTKFRYNNTGYCLLGSIIERATKKGYYEALDSYILRPAGMRSTGPESKFTPVESFDEDGTPSFKLNMDWPYSAGALVSTLGDMAKWDAALRGNKLFTPEEKSLMFNPDPVTKKLGEDYGFAWSTTYSGDKVYSHWHTGGIPGFSNIIERTANGLTTIVLANHEYINRGELANEVRDAFEPLPKPAAIEDSLPQLTAKHRTLLTDLLEGRCDESLFAPEFLKAVPVTALLSTSKELAQNGRIKEFYVIKSSGETSVRREYRVMIGSRSMTFRVAEVNGKIVGMMIG